MLSPQQCDDDGKGRATPVPPPGPRQSPNAQTLSRVPDSNGLCLCVYWCRVRDLNSRPTVYKDNWAHARNLDGIGTTRHFAGVIVGLFVVPTTATKAGAELNPRAEAPQAPESDRMKVASTAWGHHETGPRTCRFFGRGRPAGIAGSLPLSASQSASAPR